MKLPPGFKASVFAAEPDVQNAIQLTWDTHGRLWVAENYTMDSDRFVDTFRDRIVILDNADGGTKFQTRRVFTDQLKNLMGFAIGYGGVWAMTSPNILFIPDRNADGVPDGPAEVVFDGFSYTGGNMHTSANGLEFGIDGWIYGRTGHAHRAVDRSARHAGVAAHAPARIDLPLSSRDQGLRGAELRHRQPVGPGLGQARRALLRFDDRRPLLVPDARREVREQLRRTEPEGLRADRSHRRPPLRRRFECRHDRRRRWRRARRWQAAAGARCTGRRPMRARRAVGRRRARSRRRRAGSGRGAGAATRRHAAGRQRRRRGRGEQAAADAAAGDRGKPARGSTATRSSA